MHEVVGGARTKGRCLLDNKSIYADDVDPFAFADALEWSSKAQSISDDVRSRQLLAGLRLSGVDPPNPDTLVEKCSCKQRSGKK